jgi:hypothetical protein
VTLRLTALARVLVASPGGGDDAAADAVVAGGPVLGRLTAGPKATTSRPARPARPSGGAPTIANDSPSEDGVPDHDLDGTGALDDHDMLAGSTTTGMLLSAIATCLDWTANAGNKPDEGQPRVGHSWPGRSGGGGGSIDNWMSSLTESGWTPAISRVELGPPKASSNPVGSGRCRGSYCFALEP